MPHEWTMYAGCKTQKNNAMTWLWPVYHNSAEKLKTAFLFAFLFLFVAIPNCLELWYEKLKIIDILYTYKSTHENICLRIKWNENKKREIKVKDCDILKRWTLAMYCIFSIRLWWLGACFNILSLFSYKSWNLQVEHWHS